MGPTPLEPKAGLDMRTLRAKYGGRLVLYGAIDARKLASTKDEIEEEIHNKVTMGKEGGGYIYHSYHSVPRSVPVQNYRSALDYVREYGPYG